MFYVWAGDIELILVVHPWLLLRMKLPQVMDDLDQRDER